MNLRFSLILITIVSWVAVGAVFVVDSDFGQEESTQDPPFFYNIPVDSLTNITLEANGEEQKFHYREAVNRWFFDELDDVPADLFRWGGITTLLGGPRTQRVVANEISDPAKYGLDSPSSRYTVTLRDGQERVMLIGNTTVNGESSYAQLEGYPQLVLVDISWQQVLDRLVTEPPYPEWMYELNPSEVREILFFDNNEVLRAYAIDRETGTYHLCDLPVQGDPCEGETDVDSEKFQSALELIADRQVEGAVALSLLNQEDFEPYGTTVESPYVAIRVEYPTSSGVTEVNRVTMTIGDVTPDGEARYAVANETSDVIRIDKEWADQILELFTGDPLIPDDQL